MCNINEVVKVNPALSSARLLDNIDLSSAKYPEYPDYMRSYVLSLPVLTSLTNIIFFSYKHKNNF